MPGSSAGGPHDIASDPTLDAECPEIEPSGTDVRSPSALTLEALEAEATTRVAERNIGGAVEKPAQTIQNSVAGLGHAHAASREGLLSKQW